MSNNSPGVVDNRQSLTPSYKVVPLKSAVKKSGFHSHMRSHILSGKSLLRAFMHWGVGRYSLSGAVIDYGSGSEKPTYYDYFKGIPKSVTLTDFFIESKNIKKLDLEKSFSLGETYNAFVCMNVMEHIFNSQALMTSMATHLKKGGVGIISTPFIFGYHPSPHDFWRFTPEAIEKMAKESGLNLTEVITLGSGMFTTALSQVWYVFPKFIRWVLFLLCWQLDGFVLKLRPVYSDKYATGYIFKVEKK